jgi:hypothetical protein
MRLCLSGSETSNGPMAQPPRWYMSEYGMTLTGQTAGLAEQLVPEVILPSQFRHGLPWAWTQSFVARSRWVSPGLPPTFQCHHIRFHSLFFFKFLNSQSVPCRCTLVSPLPPQKESKPLHTSPVTAPYAPATQQHAARHVPAPGELQQHRRNISSHVT